MESNVQDFIQASYARVETDNIFDFLVSYFLKKKSSIVGVEGASGSGKTTVTKKLLTLLSDEKAVCISLDDYLVVTKEEMLQKGIKTRYDWRTRDKEKFLLDLEELRSGNSIEKPLQDYTVERPSGEYETVEPKDYILVEGNLDMSDVCDVIIFLYAPDDILVERRFERDSKKAMHKDAGVLINAIQKSLNYYHKYLEPHAQEADFIFDTHRLVLYEKKP